MSTTEPTIVPAVSPAPEQIAAPPLPGGPVRVNALDGVRFFAFMGVFVYHALQNNAKLATWAGYGAYGVQVFFVLSGFLIGGILLGMRSQAHAPLGHRLKTFYIRRFLRIFPLYYMALFLFWLLPAFGVHALGGRQFLLWNALYLSNVKMYLDHQMMGGLSHLWSLAVEEHFYLIAPLLVLTFTIRRLNTLFIATWIVCAGFRVIFALYHDSFGDKLSPFQFDCLTVGMAAAMIEAEGSFVGLTRARAMQVGGWCAVALVATFAIGRMHFAGAALVDRCASQWLLSVAVAGLLLFLWNASATPLARFFSWGPIAYLGKISYGLYIFHLPCLVLAAALLAHYTRHGTALPALAATIALSMLSWHLYESPINNLKRFFPYAKAKKEDTAEVVLASPPA